MFEANPVEIVFRQKAEIDQLKQANARQKMEIEAIKLDKAKSKLQTDTDKKKIARLK